jgi:hypothetical protein
MKITPNNLLSLHEAFWDQRFTIPVSPNRHEINQRKIIPLKEFARQIFQIDAHDRE